jgi:predicted deacetylase
MLRIDDLCPTLSRNGWARCRRIIEEFGVRPILAVIPNNRDPALVCDGPDPGFWDQLRALETAGATIAMHGYQHLCASRARSILGLHSTSEFAGVERETQRLWIRAGFRVLHEHGLTPRLWVAPRHGFDRNTLLVLREEGLPCISDGFARAPFLSDGVIWIPQQLWGPADRRAGLWTICLHPNTASAADFENLRSFLLHHGAQFTCFDQVMSRNKAGRINLAERTYAQLALWRVKMRGSRWFGS